MMGGVVAVWQEREILLIAKAKVMAVMPDPPLHWFLQDSMVLGSPTPLSRCPPEEAGQVRYFP